MQRYNVFQAIFMSFYSSKLYRDVAQNWGGKAFLYLLLLLAICWIPFTAVLQVSLNQGYKINADKMVPQIPILTVKDGKISTPEAHAYIILDPDNSSKRLAVIDTTGQTTTLEQAQASILVTQTALITQSKPNEVRTDQVPEHLNMTVDPKVIDAYMKKYLGYAWIILFTVFLIFSYLYRIIQSLLYAIFGKIFSAIFDADLAYGQLIQLVMVALTPVIILATILQLTGTQFAYQGLPYFGLAMIYLIFAIIANKRTD